MQLLTSQQQYHVAARNIEIAFCNLELAMHKAGYDVTPPGEAYVYGLFDEAFRELELIFLKAGFDPNQPRVPAGSPRGGQWIRVENGSVTQPNPNPADTFDPALDDPPLDSVYPEAIILPILRGRIAIEAVRDVLKGIISNKPNRPRNDKLTEHGNERVVERRVSNKQVQEAIKSAQKTGNVTTKTGKYGTPQRIYKGSNGITVVIETTGRNAGKVITVWRQ